MNQYHITQRMLRRVLGDAQAASPIGKDLLEFGRLHGRALFGVTAAEARKLGWTALKHAAHTDDPRPPEECAVSHLALALAQLLQLDVVDTAILAVVFAIDRSRYPGELWSILERHGVNLPQLIGEAAGTEAQHAERRVRSHPLFRYGLAEIRSSANGRVRLDIRWALENLLDRQPQDVSGIVDMMVGPLQEAKLSMGAFGHVADGDFLLRLLRGARQECAKGVNILIHGPPGTGKTEFARSLAAAAGLALHSAGEATEDGEEPDRYDRLAAYRMGQRLLATCGNAALLFDEMEDLVGDAQPSAADWTTGRKGSKVFVNRMLETNPVPVIWTTNAIGNVDPAILRRMNYVLKMDLPSRETAMRMLGHIAREESVVPGAQWGQLVEAAPETAAVLRVAARAARLAGEDDGGVRPARALVKALRGDAEVPHLQSGAIDLDLYEADRPLGPLFDSIRQCGDPAISLLLTGVPGTGKTALAQHLARVLDRPLLIRRASDILSRWVGGTEQRIAKAFAEARQRGAVLLFDEVDSLLFDRTTARASWEVSQVNELLTWLDSHPFPVIAATNHEGRLDPATLRRFVFKIELRALSPAKAVRAYTRFFSSEPPASLATVNGLTPGDMAVVARQLRFAPASDGSGIVERLKAEVAAKPGFSQPIGF